MILNGTRPKVAYKFGTGFLGGFRPGPYLRADAAQAEVSFRNFGFSPIYQDAPIPQRDAPHKIAAAQIFFDQTGSGYHTLITEGGGGLRRL